MQSALSIPPIDTYSVDSHFHVFEAGQSVPHARYWPQYAATWTDWQCAAQPVGMTHGVVVQTSFRGTDNRYLLKILQQNPDSLRGVAVVAPLASAEHIAELHNHGVRGIRLNLTGQSHDMAAWQAATPLWDLVLQLGWHVELHTDTGALPLVLMAIPMDIPVVVDHFCRPENVSLRDTSVGAVIGRVARGSAPIYVKLSAAYRLQSGIDPKVLAALWLDQLGSEALLWGSDWPCTNFETKANYAALHGALADWLEQDAAALRAVRSANPMRLYWGRT